MMSKAKSMREKRMKRRYANGITSVETEPGGVSLKLFPKQISSQIFATCCISIGFVAKRRLPCLST